LFVFPDFARSVALCFISVMIDSAIIELLALWIGTHLTRTVRGRSLIFTPATATSIAASDHRVPVRVAGPIVNARQIVQLDG